MTQTMAATSSSSSLPSARRAPYPPSRPAHPHHPSSHPYPSHPHAHSHSQPHAPKPSVGIHELHPGPRNRLFLSLRSGIPDEIDYSLPRLVQASFEHTESFRLETWVDSVTALRYWPEKWVEGLALESAAREARKAIGMDKTGLAVAGESEGVKKCLGAVPEWTRSPQVEERAMNSLLILRNASLVPSNAKVLTRTSFATYITRFFSLPHSFLLDLSLVQPEAFLHTLVILNAMVVHLYPSPQIFKVFGTTLPLLAVDTRDMAILTAILPVLILTMNVPFVPTPTPRLVPHLLQLLTLAPAGHGLMLDLVLDLLITLTLQPQHARAILALPSFPAHLKTLVALLERDARPYTIAFDPPPAWQANTVPNPAGPTVSADAATKRRVAQHQKDQPMMEANGGPGVTRQVGDKQPTLDPATVSKLYKMKEPRRSIAWMHDTFVYSSTSQLLQVTFWHAYRDFFQNPATVEQLLSASEVIKNVTIAFPGAQARIWIDERGDQKFVIAGMGFRKESAEQERYMCQWRDCTTALGPKNPGELLGHIRSTHLATPQESCGWSACCHPSPTTAHVLTHLPLIPTSAIPVADSVSSHPSQTEDDALRSLSSLPSLSSSTPSSSAVRVALTARPAPLLPKSHSLRFTARVTPTDARRQPTGSSFLASLVVRNLARTLRAEIPEDQGEEEREEKKKHLKEERFGLPIPESVLKEEEQEEDEARGLRGGKVGMVTGNAGGTGAVGMEGGVERMLGDEERERAKKAFQQVEERVLEVVQTNISGLPQYLADAFGW